MGNSNPVAEFLKRHIFFILGGICIIIVGVLFISSQNREPEIIRSEVLYDSRLDEPLPPAEAIPAPSQTYIRIHVDGAVYLPGVFSLPAESRVEDALELAGGVTDYANMSGINRAGFLQDGMKIRIPIYGEEPEEIFINVAAPTQTNETRTDGAVNINTATIGELQTLPSIGPSRAQNIISFRETHGNFANIEELMLIPGIGAGIMNQVRDRVTVD